MSTLIDGLSLEKVAHPEPPVIKVLAPPRMPESVPMSGSQAMQRSVQQETAVVGPWPRVADRIRERVAVEAKVLEQRAGLVEGQRPGLVEGHGTSLRGRRGDAATIP